MKVTLRATFDGAIVNLDTNRYLLVRLAEMSTPFDDVEIDVQALDDPAPKPPASAKTRAPRQPRPQLQLNNGQPAPAGAVPGETPVSQTFADCVRIALRNVGPASIGDILQDLTDSEIQADRQKVTACLAGLRQRGDVIRQDDGKWRAA